MKRSLLPMVLWYGLVAQAQDKPAAELMITRERLAILEVACSSGVDQFQGGGAPHNVTPRTSVVPEVLSIQPYDLQTFKSCHPQTTAGVNLTAVSRTARVSPYTTDSRSVGGDESSFDEAPSNGEFSGGTGQEQSKGTQTAVQSFAELRGRLKVGDRIVVTDTGGGEIKGKVADISERELVIQSPQRRAFSSDSVSKIRRTDSSWNGALLGAGAGFAIAAIGIGTSLESQDDSFYIWQAVGSWLSPALGAITGYAIDRSTGNKPIYLMPARQNGSISLSPLLSKARTGVSLSVRF